MKSLWSPLLVSAVVLSGTVVARGEVLEIRDARMVYPDAVVEIDADAVFELGHPGEFRANLVFQAQDQDPVTGAYALPVLDALWSIRGADGSPQGSDLWNGGEGLVQHIYLMSWDHQTGEAVVEISVPVGGASGSSQFPYLFRIRAHGPNGELVESQIVEVLYDTPVLSDPAQLAYHGDDGKIEVDIGLLDYPPPAQHKYCRPGRGAKPRGDLEIKCTRPFIELVEPPLNPDCGSPTQALIYPTKCLPRKDASCEFEGTITVTGAKYTYVGTTDRRVGETEVAYGANAQGKAKFWLVGEVEVGVEIQFTTESAITRKCCKYEVVENESADTTEPGCKS